MFDRDVCRFPKLNATKPGDCQYGRGDMKGTTESSENTTRSQRDYTHAPARAISLYFGVFFFSFDLHDKQFWRVYTYILRFQKWQLDTMHVLTDIRLS